MWEVKERVSPPSEPWPNVCTEQGAEEQTLHLQQWQTNNWRCALSLGRRAHLTSPTHTAPSPLFESHQNLRGTWSEDVGAKAMSTFLLQDVGPSTGTLKHRPGHQDNSDCSTEQSQHVFAYSDPHQRAITSKSAGGWRRNYLFPVFHPIPCPGGTVFWQEDFNSSHTRL